MATLCSEKGREGEEKKNSTEVEREREIERERKRERERERERVGRDSKAALFEEGRRRESN